MCYFALLVDVADLKGVRKTEHRIGFKLLPEVLGLYFDSEVSSHKFFEVEEGERDEYVLWILAGKASILVIGLSRAQNLRIVTILRDECVTKFSKSEFTVTILVVASEEQFKLIVGRAYPQLVHKSIVKFVDGQASSPQLVENFKRVEQVEVGVHR